MILWKPWKLWKLRYSGMFTVVNNGGRSQKKRLYDTGDRFKVGQVIMSERVDHASQPTYTQVKKAGKWAELWSRASSRQTLLQTLLRNSTVLCAAITLPVPSGPKLRTLLKKRCSQNAPFVWTDVVNALFWSSLLCCLRIEQTLSSSGQLYQLWTF